jgi:hypothetical protein
VPHDTSTQEMLNFISLVREGFVPNAAVFIDGLNESTNWDGNWWYGRIIASRISLPALAILSELPMTRLARVCSRHFFGYREVNTLPPNQSQQRSDEVIERWMSNRRIIEDVAAGKGTKLVFVWQPVPMYKYDFIYHILNGLPAAQSLFAAEKLVPLIFPRLERLNQEGALGKDFLYLGNIQQNKKENLYVDVHHYTYGFSKDISARIGASMKSKGLI